MTWNCSHCQEDIDQGFDVCWACGTRYDGTIDTEFRHADAYEPPIAEENLQYGLKSILKLLTALCLVFPLFASSAVGSPNIVTAILGFGAIGYLSLHAMSWFTTRRVHRWQQHLRADPDETTRR